MAFAASGAGHQFGGGQYKSGNHGQSGRLSKMGLMSQMSDSQLLSYGESFQDIKEQDEKSMQEVNSNGVDFKHFLNRFKKKNSENETITNVKETEDVNNRYNLLSPLIL